MTGDVFGEFVRQIPIGLILNVCLAGGLLLAAFVYFYLKREKNRKLKAEQQAMSKTSDLPPPTMPDSVPQPAARRIDTGELPDLDLLLSPAASAPTRAVQPGAYSVKLHTGQTTEAAEVLAILRDSADGRLIVQMNGSAYRTLANVPDVKQQFSKIMKELAEVIVKPDSITEAVSPVQTPAPSTPVEQAPPPVTDTEAMPRLGDLVNVPTPAAAPRTPPVRTAGPLPGDLPTFKVEEAVKPVKGGGFLGRKKFEAEPVPEINIAASIEAYLQHKLESTSEYTGRRIHVHSAPGGGVTIEVDGRFFSAVSDVDDAEVRNFLSATIQEWQERQ